MTSHDLEELLPLLPRLNGLSVEEGETLQGLEEALGKHCPELKKLVAETWDDEDLEYEIHCP